LGIRRPSPTSGIASPANTEPDTYKVLECSAMLFQSSNVVPGNAAAALVAGAGAISVVTQVRPATGYMAFSVAGYCLRRGVLHKSSDGASALGAAEVLRRHLEYEADWHRPTGIPWRGRLAHICHVLLWLFVFQPAYPLLETVLFPFDLAAFWFYYPKARGSGLIIDSRALRRAGKRGNAAQVLRLDWHRFELNVGKAYPPPNTGRHPPSVLCNLPHVDLPQRGTRHWPWRQHTARLMSVMPRPRPEGQRRQPTDGNRPI
jgi:hypothetical protein